MVAINGLGAHLGATTIPTNRKGYRDLETWGVSLGAVRAIGIEGTGSYIPLAEAEATYYAQLEALPIAA